MTIQYIGIFTIGLAIGIFVDMIFKQTLNKEPTSHARTITSEKNPPTE